MTSNPARYLTTEELAVRARAPIATVRYWRQAGKGPSSFRFPGTRRVLYAIEDVEVWEQEARAVVEHPQAEPQSQPRNPLPTTPVPVARVADAIARAIEAEGQFEGLRAQRVIRMCAEVARRFPVEVS